jgi:hypothetical protein
MIKEIKIIYSDEARAGEGIESNPVRVVYRLWTHKGRILTEYDPVSKKSIFNLDALNDFNS